MYVVVERKEDNSVYNREEIKHLNPAPVSQDLEGPEVYHAYDSETMRVGKTDCELPVQFKIDAVGFIHELDAAEKVWRGLLTLAEDEKISEGTIVKKTLAELVAEGVRKLEPEEKLAGNQIVQKTLAEKVADGLIKLEANEKVVAEEVKTLTAREMLAEGRMTLEEYKSQSIAEISWLAFEKREAILPAYRLQNAALGIYEPETIARYQATVNAFREEFYRIKGEIERATSLEEIESIRENFPTELG